jgi:hypothetical protein
MECDSHAVARRACRGALQHSVRPFLSTPNYIIRRLPIQAACQTAATPFVLTKWKMSYLEIGAAVCDPQAGFTHRRSEEIMKDETCAKTPCDMDLASPGGAFGGSAEGAPHTTIS